MNSDRTTRSASGQDDPLSTGGIITAAGGVVLETHQDTLRVLVVHRPAYDDWSLPKGHHELGEGLEATAVREVEEETGVHARVLGSTGTTEHVFASADEGVVTKRVHWFLMHPSDPSSDPSLRPPDHEVDHAVWWPASAALADLTHAGERELLGRVLEEISTPGTVRGTVD